MSDTSEDNQMIDSELDWFSQDPASLEAVKHLRDVVPDGIPDTYFKLLEFSNGGEGPLSVFPYNFCLDSIEVVISNLDQETFSEFFPDFYIFGGSGGGELIAFDLREGKEKAIVAIDMANMDLAESVHVIAGSLEAFLEYVGLE